MVVEANLQQLWLDLYEKRGKGWLTVVSGSMHPMIKVGDRVLVTRFSPRLAHFGDVIVFRKRDELVVHRIIGRNCVGGTAMIMQKGDANAHGSLIDPRSILGKVICIHRESKYLWMNSLSGKLLNLFIGTTSYLTLALSLYPLSVMLDRVTSYSITRQAISCFWVSNDMK
jgi:signal peptidase I